MIPVEWCNLCQQRPATGILTGYFLNLEEEVFDLRACDECARKSLVPEMLDKEAGNR